MCTTFELIEQTKEENWESEFVAKKNYNRISDGEIKIDSHRKRIIKTGKNFQKKTVVCVYQSCG